MFSVVIPLYNKASNISKTILTVLNQNFSKFEIIIVNDGSTDNSLDIVKTFSDERIVVIDQKNGGVSKARNTGIEHAKNDWIAFLDADDLWKPNHLETIYEMIIRFPNYDVYSTSFEYSDLRARRMVERTSQYYPIVDYFKDSLNEQVIWTSSVVVKR